ncbi:CIA30 family protein [Flavobacteriales bacterium]|jgi:NADH dehydrogenase [ubiquinone] 1 alpha subcomplex assembly factor 1|nr:CIA30 family protein [Flavobacteriales bacterium]
MKYLICSMVLFSSLSSFIIFDFNKNSSISNWVVVDDVVMGGRSTGNFKLNKDGNGVFYGNVSLDNNGGFSSLRHGFNKLNIEKFKTLVLKIKGDGKNYQFRIKHKSSDYASYITSFSSSGEWQEIEIPINSMYPSFRGRKLDEPNFSHESVEEITFLIANKKNEDFMLIIDKIELK